MNKNLDDLFRLAQIYKPQSVGVEVTGQQGGFIQWIQDQMMEKNIYFPLASEGNNNSPGVRPNTNKMVRFNTVVPLFKAGKMYFPVEKKSSKELIEFMNELSLASVSGFKSKHDDCIDTVSMLSLLRTWRPSEEAVLVEEGHAGMWDMEDSDTMNDRMASYVV
jgi:hypothetical protein